jgi:exosortase/archaeosortase family protein
LGAVGFEAETAGNVILVGPRMTIVAIGCSGLGGALFAGLGALALMRWRGGALPRGAGVLAFAGAAAVAFLANLVRLAMMATDATLYALAHGQAGAFATDLVASAGVILAVLGAEQRRP